MKAVVLVLALSLVAVAVSEKRLGNNRFNGREQLANSKTPMGEFLGQDPKANSRTGDAVCDGKCKSRDNNVGVCRKTCIPGEFFDPTVNCNSNPDKLCVCCVPARILESKKST